MNPKVLLAACGNALKADVKPISSCDFYLLQCYTGYMRFFSYILLVLGILVLCGPAQAQEHAPLPPADDVPLSSPRDHMDDVPDAYIEEANAFYDECSASDLMSQYYNCECYSLAYLDKRIEMGPTVVRTSILSEIENECRDAVGAAGRAYMECLSKANMFKPGTDPEEYCECVANTYVDMMNTAAPRVSSRSIVRLQTYSYTACTNSQTGRPEVRFEDSR